MFKQMSVVDTKDNRRALARTLMAKGGVNIASRCYAQAKEWLKTPAYPWRSVKSGSGAMADFTYGKLRIGVSVAYDNSGSVDRDWLFPKVFATVPRGKPVRVQRDAPDIVLVPVHISRNEWKAAVVKNDYDEQLSYYRADGYSRSAARDAVAASVADVLMDAGYEMNLIITCSVSTRNGCEILSDSQCITCYARSTHLIDGVSVDPSERHVSEVVTDMLQEMVPAAVKELKDTTIPAVLDVFADVAPKASSSVIKAVAASLDMALAAVQPPAFDPSTLPWLTYTSDMSEAIHAWLNKAENGGNWARQWLPSDELLDSANYDGWLLFYAKLAKPVYVSGVLVGITYKVDGMTGCTTYIGANAYCVVQTAGSGALLPDAKSVAATQGLADDQRRAILGLLGDYGVLPANAFSLPLTYADTGPADSFAARLASAMAVVERTVPLAPAADAAVELTTVINNLRGVHGKCH